MRNEHRTVLATGDFVDAQARPVVDRIDAFESLYVQARRAPWYVRATGTVRVLAV
ncbi:MAG: hypothetical protein AAGA68_27220 [Pseudomonadota bacterium]